jgi:signal transduction histidine kinase
MSSPSGSLSECRAENQELREENLRLEELNVERTRLLSMAAHDLCNPITVIRGYSELLVREDLPADVHALLEHIETSSSFMVKLLNNLLDVSQIEAGHLDLKTKSTDLAALVEKNVVLNRILATRKDMTIELDIEDGLSEAEVDPTKIEQVLNNLLSNAVKYSFAESRITVRVGRGEDEILVTVRDEGQGIPPEEVEQIFQEFARASVKTTGGERSTGLGLAIAKRVIEAHGGNLGVWSSPGEGSTFYFSLPLDPRSERLRYRLPMRFTVPGASLGGSATVLNLSDTGALLETAVPLEAGRQIRFTVVLSEASLTGTAELVREETEGRFGVRFQGFDGNGEEELQEFLQTLSSAA